MIQPLNVRAPAWTVHYTELNEPASTGAGVILPGCLVIVGGNGRTVLDQRVMGEPNQRRVERLLWRLASQHPPPRQLVLPDLEEWSHQGWQGFSRFAKCNVKFVDPAQLRLPSSLAEEVPEAIARELEFLSLESAGERAQAAVALAESSRHLRSPRQRLRYLKRGLELSPAHPTVHFNMAEYCFQESDYPAALQHCAVILGDSTSRAHHAESEGWDNPRVRLLLKTLMLRMMAAWYSGQLEGAITDARRLLEQDPSDHGGVRFLFPLLCLLAEHDEEAIQFFEAYGERYQHDFPDPALLFGWGLTLWRVGDENGALEKYRLGMLQNLFIAPLLLEMPDPPMDIHFGNDRAEPEFAEEFCDSFAQLWDRDPEARRGLKECLALIEPQLKEIVSLRRRMVSLQDQRYSSKAERDWKRLQLAEQKIYETELQFPD